MQHIQPRPCGLRSVVHRDRWQWSGAAWGAVRQAGVPLVTRKPAPGKRRRPRGSQNRERLTARDREEGVSSVTLSGRATEDHAAKGAVHGDVLHLRHIETTRMFMFLMKSLIDELSSTSTTLSQS